MDPSIRRAIARIEVKDREVVHRRGTACLVGENLVLTALHVIADRATDPPAFLPGRIEITFPDHESIVTTVVGGKWDSLQDWALLRCASRESSVIPPLQLAKLGRDGDQWTAYGFPEAEPAGLTVHGTVTNSHAELFGGTVPVYQLFCQEAAAGKGLRAKGLSGGPVIVGQRVVGVIRRAPLDDDRVEAGTLYACPASLVAARCGQYFPEPLKAVSSHSLLGVPLREATYSTVHAIVGSVKLLVAVLMGSMLVAMVLRYAYRTWSGDSPTPEVTTLFVVVAVLLVGAATIGGRKHRAKSGLRR